jgi:dienelactone hydrolase
MTPDVVELLRAGRFAEIRELFTPQLRPLVPADAIGTAWTAAVAQYGELTEAGAPVSDQGTIRVPLTFERGRLTLVLQAGPGGLGGLQLAPAEAAEPVAPWTPPSYADSARFEEQDVVLGSGPLAVGGTVSVPNGSGPWPAVVLLSGSGAHDRDETIGRNKPLKDVAWGLASRGVAVLRFEKVTHAHPREARANPGFTVYDEYAPAALAAVELLKQRKDIGRIHLLGHSLGGTVAPRIAAEAPAVAGVILMAGGAEPLHRAALRQMRHIGSPEGTIAAIAKQAAMVDSPDLSPDTPVTELPFGVPGAYWLDLRAYDAPTAAAALDVPILVLQGARDYQVTVEDDLASWQEKLAGRPQVTVRVYDADNHLFFPGSGPSMPGEYEPAQHVDPEVIADIARWLAP